MKSKGPGQPTGCPQAWARSACPKCGNEAHTGNNTCPATGRRCLRCGRLGHFAHMCNQDKQANSLELERKRAIRRGVSVPSEGRQIAEPKSSSYHQWNSHPSTPGHAGRHHDGFLHSTMGSSKTNLHTKQLPL